MGAGRQNDHQVLQVLACFREISESEERGFLQGLKLLDPPSSGMFSTPLGYHCSVLPVQHSKTEQTRS